MAIERQDIKLVKLRLVDQGPEIFWPVGQSEGKSYWAGNFDSTEEWMDQNLLHTNRRPSGFKQVDGLSTSGTVVDLDAAMRGNLIFLEGDDGDWVEAIKNYTPQVGGQTNE